ncbi:hypothetical protein [Glutamicibacter sp. FBE19]|uniref:hypothetical protein n=1 Tax=Glutamicibacter sp. FBE19 TaxID=2761534 RepID=UPI001FD10EA5|nr:hypothetical protein [Glutamicibacter sp. FBE19]
MRSPRHHLRLIRRAVERHHERPARWVHTVVMPPNSRSSFYITIQASRCSLAAATGRSLGWTQYAVLATARSPAGDRAGRSHRV